MREVAQDLRDAALRPFDDGPSSVAPAGLEQWTAQTPKESFRSALASAWAQVSSDDPKRQLSMYELTAYSIRTDPDAKFARAQYEQYRDVARRATAPWLERYASPDLPGGPEALTQLVEVVFDGTVLAWLADPGRTRPDLIFDLLAEVMGRAVGDRVRRPPGSGA